MKDRWPPAIDVDVEREDRGEITHVRVRFGPHFAVDIHDEEGRVTFQLVHTHHGFKADASELGGELEELIEEIRRLRPTHAVD
jgi:hypothetical protein